MSQQKERVLDLIEFCLESAKLRNRPYASVNSHGIFHRFEEELISLPGLHFNVASSGDDGSDDIWLIVDRLQETSPPAVSNERLMPWVELSRGVDLPPSLKARVAKNDIKDEKIRGLEGGVANQNGDDAVDLEVYEEKEQIKRLFEAYLKEEWEPWANQERLRLKTISLYGELFALKQRIDGGVDRAPVELVWGTGVSLWHIEDKENKIATLKYPLIVQSVEIRYNSDSFALEVCPTQEEPKLELDWYADQSNLGVSALDGEAKRYLLSLNESLSPFVRSGYEPLLRTTVVHLDSKGEFLSLQESAEDRRLPKPQEHLTVTDTWVVFARQRNANVYIEDLIRLKDDVQSTEILPAAVNSIVTPPSSVLEEEALLEFRGMSASYYGDDFSGGNGGGHRAKAQELFFPLPFNEEQVKIVQLLERHDGVVVQGPPGTGKTHTIANVISHYLANGKRVLVSSMKEPALEVLRDKLPEEVRSVVIPLLTNVAAGEKAFEFAITKIAAEIQSLDRAAVRKEIKELQSSIDTLHGRLAHIDSEISNRAKLIFSSVNLDGQDIDPKDAAKELVSGEVDCSFIPDDMDVDPAFKPKFSNEDYCVLREARRLLGEDINYLGKTVPALGDLPDMHEILKIHNDIISYKELRSAEESGGLPGIKVGIGEVDLKAFANEIEDLLHQGRRLSENRQFEEVIRLRLANTLDFSVIEMLERLGDELKAAGKQYRSSLEAPVELPDGVEDGAVLLEAVNNLAQGKRPFGILPWGRSAERKAIQEIRVLGTLPSTAEAWSRVADAIKLRKLLKGYSIRWNVLAEQLRFPVVEVSQWGGMNAVQYFETYEFVKSTIRSENYIREKAMNLLSFRSEVDSIKENSDAFFVNLRDVVRQHIERVGFKRALGQVGDILDNLSSMTGRVSCDMVDFLKSKLGQPGIALDCIRQEWECLLHELSRVNSLGKVLSDVDRVVSLIKASGAPKYALSLCAPLSVAVDSLMPVNWERAWRLKRLDAYLERTDGHRTLRVLAVERKRWQDELAAAYQQIVVKRTWLSISENASPSVRSALQGFLSAIQKIGKGTGVRAIRHRRDARKASELAAPAVPCWIMPHYRVSEAIPSKLGCFDLVIIDEASQSDLTALPILLRGKKVLVVGDDKQVSPEGVGLEEAQVRYIMDRWLKRQVDIFRGYMSPDRSIYDLYKVVNASSSLMLKEHFRCVAPIIEYSRREFYNFELHPLRVPRASERMDPPLVDIYVTDGVSKGKVNAAEARVIVDEIKAIVGDSRYRSKTIGVVSLLGDSQAHKVLELLVKELEPEVFDRHQISCGDAKTFQGKERDIVFLSMVVASNEKFGTYGRRAMYEQRFNVAASRARDRMYLVRSVEIEQLSDADVLRRGLISHFAMPFGQKESRCTSLRDKCESEFEKEVYDALVERGYRVTPQVKAGRFRIDLVVEGDGDARLAVECDGDRYHGPDRWFDDIQRQRILERAGWSFWRCFASSWIRNKAELIDDLIQVLGEHGVSPSSDAVDTVSRYTEHRRISSIGYELSIDETAGVVTEGIVE